MRIPNEIKIGGLVYDIKYTKHLIRDRSVHGQSCGNLQDIEIDEGLAEQLQETTLIHEIFEQFNFVYNIGLEHHQIYLLEAALYALIKDNPEIFKDKKK